MPEAFSLKIRSQRASVALTLIAGIAVACGSAESQGGGLAQGPSDRFRAAPIEGTPEQTAADISTEWRAAPIEGTPEQTAVELGR